MSNIPIFQQLARGHSSGRDDVRAVPAVAAQRRGSVGRARDRHQPRHRPEPVWSAVSGEVEPSIHFPGLVPEYAPEHENCSGRWVNVLRLQNYGNDDRFALVLPSSFTDVETWRFRAGDAAFVTREGFILPQRYRGLRQYFRLPEGTQAVTAWLGTHDVKASSSDAGRIAEQILVSIGGIRGATLLADRDTLKLSDNMAKSVRRHADGTIEEFEDRATAVERWKALGHRRTNAGPYQWINLDAFVKANVLKLGLSVACPNCMKMNWVGLAAMSDQLICERCLAPFAFPQGTLDFEHTPWRYRVVGPFSVPDFAGGAYATVLALRVFGDMVAGVGDGELTYAAGLEFAGVGTSPFEVDFTFWYRRHAMFGRSEEPLLVFGEAKSLRPEGFKGADIDRMSKAAEKFPGAFIVFATLKDELSEAEKSSIGDLAMRGRSRLEDGKPCSPVIVLTGTELFASWRLGQAWKEKGGQHARFAEFGGLHLDNLSTLAELTQQLYWVCPIPGRIYGNRLLQSHLLDLVRVSRSLISDGEEQCLGKESISRAT